jgi:hypothetical protein
MSRALRSILVKTAKQGPFHFGTLVATEGNRSIATRRTELDAGVETGTMFADQSTSDGNMKRGQDQALGFVSVTAPRTRSHTHLSSDCVRFEAFMAVTMKNSLFCDVTPCGSCKNRRFGGTQRFHHQGDKIR